MSSTLTVAARVLDDKLVEAFTNMPKGARKKIMATLEGDRPILVGVWVGTVKGQDCGCLMMDGCDIDKAKKFVYDSRININSISHREARYVDFLAKFYRLRGSRPSRRVGKMAEAYDNWARYRGTRFKYVDTPGNTRVLSSKGKSELIELLGQHV